MSYIPSPVPVAEGGTGSATAGTARTNLGLGTLATQNANSVTISGGTVTGITDLAVADGGTGASTLTGYVKGNGTSAMTASATIPNTDITGLGTIATQAASNVTITGGSITGITDLALADGGTGASTASGARTNLGLGTIATQDASNVTISGGAISGITDLAVVDGGTGASTAANARTNLGVTATGSDTTYAYRANNLSDLANATTARTNLGLGSIATQAASSVSISGGSISGITDLAVADGGTGASTAANARTNLGLVIGTDVPGPTGSGASGTWTINVNASSLAVGSAGLPASGAGLKFPATQSASSDANTLDDYEEGTWTPYLYGADVAGAGTYSTQQGTYTKIGRVVYFRFAVTTSAHSGSGYMYLTLPFTSGLAERQHCAVCELSDVSFPSGRTAILGYINASASGMFFAAYGDAQTTDAITDGVGAFNGSGFYIA